MENVNRKNTIFWLKNRSRRYFAFAMLFSLAFLLISVMVVWSAGWIMLSFPIILVLLIVPFPLSLFFRRVSWLPDPRSRRHFAFWILFIFINLLFSVLAIVTAEWILFSFVIFPGLHVVPGYLSFFFRRTTWVPELPIWVTSIILLIMVILAGNLPFFVAETPLRAILAQTPLLPDAKVTKRSMGLSMGDGAGRINIKFTSRMADDNITSFYGQRLAAAGWNTTVSKSEVQGVNHDKKCTYVTVKVFQGDGENEVDILYSGCP
jgi:hypothetical protein